MSTAPAFSLSWILLAAFGAAASFPAGGAPLPLDPALSAIAPETCLWYAASAGSGIADPASANHTEQLVAEPEVKRFLGEVDEQITAALRRSLRSDALSRALATEVPKILKILLTRPLALYVEEVQVQADRSWNAEAAVVVNAGHQKSALEASLQSLVESASSIGPHFIGETVTSGKWVQVALPSNWPEVRFGWRGDYFIVAVGHATPERIVERLQGARPEWLAQLRAEHPIGREMVVQYVNVAALLQSARPLVESQNPAAWSAMEKLGLTKVQAIHSLSGYDAEGCASDTHLVTDQGRPGLLAFLPHRRLTKDDLAIVPKDALAAIALQLDPSEVLDQTLALVSQFDPRAAENLQASLWQLDSHVGFSIREEIVDSLGNAWVVYLPSGDLLLSWLNAAAAIEVKDAPALREAADQLIDLARGEMARTEAHATITESEVDDQIIYKLELEGAVVPFSPSLCITDDWLVIGLLPHAVQAAVERRADDSLATNTVVAPLFERDLAPAAILYQDTPQLIRSAYPFVQIGLQMLSSQLRAQAISIDTTMLPSAETVVKHLRPSVRTWRHSSEGFYASSRGSLPSGGTLIGAAPVVAGLVMPAMQQARERERGAEEVNNLRQLSMAFMNYESAHRSFPNDVYNDNGEPLLSWRVRVLPFLEVNGSEIYQEMRLDEPWDSEHNRQFHTRMPDVFASPSAALPPGYTRLKALSGPGTAFLGNEKLGYPDLTDGASNTVQIVQSAPEAAVEWMKPADIDYDLAAPFAGVAQPSGAFLAAFCDGAVRQLSLAIGADTMRAIASRAGGESIEYDALSEPPAPELYEALEPAAAPASAQ